VLTHVVTVDGKATGLTRDPETGWAKMVLATTGVALRAGVSDIDATILVRPIALDSVTIASTGWTQLDNSSCGDTLDAGRSCTWWSRGTASSSPIVVDGLLWNRKVTRIVQLDPRRATAMARELSASRPLDDTAQLAIDQAAHAVNEHWSLGVFWGGSAGYDTLFGIGRSATTTARDGVRGVSITPPTLGPVIAKTDLRPQFAPAVERCHAAGRKVSIDLETTHKEIVDVAVTVAPADDAIQACLVEAVWDTELDTHDDLDHITRHVAR
jgi:hypothetical protein